MTREAYECEFQALITEREGMLAENTCLAQSGYPVTYAESNFRVLADRFRQLARDFKGGDDESR